LEKLQRLIYRVRKLPNTPNIHGNLTQDYKKKMLGAKYSHIGSRSIGPHHPSIVIC